MAVELNRVSKDPSLSLFYYFEKEEQLENISNTSYSFAETTTSQMKLHDNEYKPVRIHLTTVLHKGSGSHDFELIVELHHVNSDVKLFICLALKKKKEPFFSEITFPLKECPLEKMFYSFSNANILYYKTTTNSHVFFSATEIYVGDDFPNILVNAKAKYKEIFEPNAFDIFNNLFTRNDYKLKVIPVVECGLFKQYTRTITEGFGTFSTTDSYMECELLKEEKGGKTSEASEYAITPLNGKAYARGISTISNFSVFLFLIGLGGILLPWVQCNAYSNNIASHSSWKWGFTFFHVSLFICAFIMLIVGIDKKKTIIATLGFYFLIIFLSNVVGMKIMFPSCDALYNNAAVTKWSYIYTIFIPMLHIKDDDPP